MGTRILVAIVGRPNVGKSTLFNRLVGWRKAIVDKTSGLTRDRLYGVAQWQDKEFMVVDTGGVDPFADDSMQHAIRGQAEAAVAQADRIIFLLDAREGFGPTDFEIARWLRPVGDRVLVVGNKVEDPASTPFAYDLYRTGFGEPLLISAYHGLGIDDLLDRIVAAIPEVADPEPPGEELAALAIMGRPNVGKSSILNAILGEHRSLVTDLPGTTRDPVDTVIEFDGQPVRLVDTAGIRRRSAARDRLESFSLIRGLKAMERSDVVILVTEATEGIISQDRQIAAYALEAGKGVVIVRNKSDLISHGDVEVSPGRAGRGPLKFGFHIPVLTTSAVTGAAINRILPVALEVAGRRSVRMPTNELNRVIRQAMVTKPPPSFKGRRLHLNFATQASSRYPTVVLFVNDLELLHFSYRRYLENQLRAAFGLEGSPLRIVLRQHGVARAS